MSLRDEVAAAAKSYDEHIEQLYCDKRFELAARHGVTEDEVDAIWAEVAP